MLNRFILLGAFLIAASPVRALDFLNTDTYELKEGEVLASELWLKARTVDVRGEVNDDLFVLAISNAFSGVAQQDVWAAGQDTSLSGEVKDDARLAGLNVRVEGQVGGELMAAGGETVQLGPHARVAGQSLLTGGHVLLAGEFGDKVRVLAQSVTVSGHLQKDLRVVAEDIVILKGTRLDGNLIYTSPKELFLNEDVQLGGQLIRREMMATAIEIPLRSYILIQAWLFVGALLVGFPLIGIFPRFTGRAAECIRRYSFRCALTGFLTLCLLPILCYLALFTLVGIPLSLVLALLLILLVYLSKLVVALALGSLLLRQPGTPRFIRVIWSFAAGLLLLYFLTLLPKVGNIVWLLIVFSGAGAMVLAATTPERPRSPVDVSADKEP